MFSFTKFGAVTGSALTVLALVSISWRPALSSDITTPKAVERFEAQYTRALKLWSASQYVEAGIVSARAAKYAEQQKLYRQAAKGWHLSASCSLIDLRLKDSLNQFQHGMEFAKISNNRSLEVAYHANIAAVYHHLGNAPAALLSATQGLAAVDTGTPPAYAPALKLQYAHTLAVLHRFGQALPAFREAITALEENGDYRNERLSWELYGSAALDAGDFRLAEKALSRAVYLAGIYRIDDYSGVLSKLARLRELNGQPGQARSLYDAAVRSTPAANPRWLAYADRGTFRLAQNDLRGAYSDFQSARSLVHVLREEVVPNDQGRVHLENGLARVADGFIDAGNRLALSAGGQEYVAETFDAAEHYRSLTLAALTPETADWRSRLPTEYWDLLSQFRALQREAYSSNSSAARSKADALQLRLSRLEADSGNDRKLSASSALQSVREALGTNEVFLGFHTGERQSWLWTVYQGRVRVYALPPAGQLEKLVGQFRESVRQSSGYRETGNQLFQALFDQLPKEILQARRWLLEPDGPLFDLPFAALPAQDGEGFLCERVALQFSPGASLLRKGKSLANATFLGIADPVYNAADPRFHGKSGKAALVLPRLPASSGEVNACSRLWPGPGTRVLAGPDATNTNLLAALKRNPEIVHFATHIISAPGEYRSGLIALSLDGKGDMDLLGPTEIIARRLDAELVVMNGCQSAQAQKVPGSGLMGLTRAWIASGVNNVLATQWDVADGDSQALLTAFYSALREQPAESPAYALQRARVALLSDPEFRKRPSTWAAYFLLSRT